MDVFRHHDKSMKAITALAVISEKSCQKDSHVVLDDEKASTTPGAKGYKVSSGRRNESSRLQGKSQRLKPRAYPSLNRHE